MTKPREKKREELQAEIEDGKKKIRQLENREKVLRQMLLSGISRRKSLSCSIGLPKQKRNLPSRRHPTLFLC